MSKIDPVQVWRSNDCGSLKRLPFRSASGSGPFRVTAEGAALNELQMEAVKQGLQRRFSVVQGPPGTGWGVRCGFQLERCLFFHRTALQHLHLSCRPRQDNIPGSLGHFPRKPGGQPDCRTIQAGKLPLSKPRFAASQQDWISISKFCRGE